MSSEFFALAEPWDFVRTGREAKGQGSASFFHYDTFKSVLDRFIALVALLLLAPFFAVIAFLVARDGGPVFFAHRRVGQHGRPFPCLKFRTMAVDADRQLADLLRRDPAARAEWDAFQKLRADPRVTRVGRFLRSTSLDELPQLFNVLRGQMSLVGPRPVTLAELGGQYAPRGATLAYVRVRPGVTGLWQISGRSSVGYAERVALDCRYVAERSAWTDLSILLRTVPAVLARRGAV